MFKKEKWLSSPIIVPVPSRPAVPLSSSSRPIGRPRGDTKLIISPFILTGIWLRRRRAPNERACRKRFHSLIWPDIFSKSRNHFGVEVGYGSQDWSQAWQCPGWPTGPAWSKRTTMVSHNRNLAVQIIEGQIRDIQGRNIGGIFETHCVIVS